MEIENSRIASLVSDAGGHSKAVDRTAGDTGGSPEKASTGNSGADKVSLTGDARKLQDLEHQLESQPVVDSQRVDAVRSAVENGTFEVNPDRIADKILSLEEALTDAR